MYICIDFDGTCVTHEFPSIGKDIGAIPVLKELVNKGHKLILFTMRSNMKDVKSLDYNIHSQSGNYLDEAVEWFKNNKIPLYGINVNPDQITWTESPKAYGHLYIDDAALGVPLKYNINISERPFVDWEEVYKLLKSQNII